MDKMEAGEIYFGVSLKYISLIVLCVQNSTLAILMRLSTVGSEKHFLASTAVVLAELFKVCGSVVLLLKHERNAGNTASSLRIVCMIINDKKEMLRISVPAILYYIQNNLQYVAIANLDAATFQVMSQLKILTTALFSISMLGKSILPLQWLAILILMIGVALVQLQQRDPSTSAAVSDDQNMVVGLISVVLACCCSGFAGIYFEKILKKQSGKSSIWGRNIQMGMISGIIGLFSIFVKDHTFLQEKGFFYGYGPIVWTCISVNAFGGLLTAVVVKYADNILKGFATSIAICLSCVMSFFLFGTQPTGQFVLGAIFVNSAVFLYGAAPTWRTSPRHEMSDKVELIKLRDDGRV